MKILRKMVNNAILHNWCANCAEHREFKSEPYLPSLFIKKCKICNTVFVFNAVESGNDVVEVPDSLCFWKYFRPFIDAAAMIYEGKLITLPRPNRHHNIIAHIVNILKASTRVKGEQGFVDNTGIFVDRRTALKIALDSNQVLDIFNIKCNMLFSEDLW